MKWLPGNQFRSAGLFHMDGEWITFKSDAPWETRIVVLTDEYRYDQHHFIPPECLAPEPYDPEQDFVIGPV